MTYRVIFRVIQVFKIPKKEIKYQTSICNKKCPEPFILSGFLNIPVFMRKIKITGASGI